jgi:hypothetical protein
MIHAETFLNQQTTSLFLSGQKFGLHLYGIFAHNSIFTHLIAISLLPYFPYLWHHHIHVYIPGCLSVPSLFAQITFELTDFHETW